MPAVGAWARELARSLATPADTTALGEALGRVVGAGDVLGLVGPLGAGKTLLVQGLARGLGVPVTTPVVSPSYALVARVDGGRLPLVHADLYRLEHAAELIELGLDDAAADGAVLAVEWIDRFPAAIEPDRLELRLGAEGDGRLAELFARGPVGRALAARLRAVIDG